MSELTPAFILHHRPYRETSQILDIFSREQGRMSLVARGKRKQNKSAPLELFQPLLISWYGKGELKNLSQVEVSQPPFKLLGKTGLCGFYLNELLIRLLPVFESEPDLFDTYQQTLTDLQSGHSEQIVLRLFEKRLLTILGYGLQLRYEVDTNAEIDEQARYHYDFERGPVRVNEMVSDTHNTITGRSLICFDKEMDFDETNLREIKRLMRTTIDFYLGGRPLQSRKLFADLEQFK